MFKHSTNNIHTYSLFRTIRCLGWYSMWYLFYYVHVHVHVYTIPHDTYIHMMEHIFTSYFLNCEYLYLNPFVIFSG